MGAPRMSGLVATPLPRHAATEGGASGAASGLKAPPGTDDTRTGGARTGDTHTGDTRTGEVTLNEVLGGLEGTEICIFYQDADLRHVWMANAPAGFEGIIGRTDHDLLPNAAIERAIAAKMDAMETGEKRRARIELRDGPGRRWFDLWIEPRRGADGARGVLCYAVDTSERLDREERLRVLLREVSHRSRNLLAIVQSIASQTVRTASAPSRFLERFNERLQSLAHTLDLVTVSEWEGATVHQLVSRQAGPFVSETGVLEIAGPDPTLSPNAALHLGLAVQELASNATSHGIWSHSDGMVYARTRMDGADLVFEWIEAGLKGNETVIPASSFGSRTLLAIVPAAVGGTASMEREGSQFVYRLTVPAENFEL